MTALLFGPIEAQALHIAVDLQRLFAEPGDWYTPRLNDIVPAVSELAGQRPDNTVFTRFITAHSAADAKGTWQRYYRHWQALTLQEMAAERLALVSALQRFVPPAQVVDKTTHCAFESAAFIALLEQRQPQTLIFTGVETDVCVLASVLSAVDRGYRAIVVEDAVTSSCDKGHRATLDAVLPRFDQQIEIASVATVLSNWSH